MRAGWVPTGLPDRSRRDGARAHPFGPSAARRRGLMLSAAIGALALVSGCSSQGIYSLPLPGGADLGAHPMRITIDFADVLDLVPQSAVKVDGVAVGRVDNISVAPSGWTARVRVLVNNSVRLPANARAEVRQSNLLGEKFIELQKPLTVTPASAELRDGAAIPLNNTRTAVEVEQVLGAMSMLLNGGGIAHLQPIVTELNKVLGGREPRVRALLEQANTLVGGLRQQVTDIQRALDGLDTLSSRLGEQTGKITKVLDELPEGLQILEEQRPQLIALLAQLDRVGRVGFDVVNTSKRDLIRDLRALRPVLQELGKATPDLVTALPLAATYPFSDAILLSTFGGQVNTFLSVDTQLGVTLSNLGVGKPDPVYYAPRGAPVIVNPANPYFGGNGPRPGWPTVAGRAPAQGPQLPAIPGLPALPLPVLPPNPFGLLIVPGIGGQR